MTREYKKLQHFTDAFSLEHLINETTCFKGRPSCINLIITNRKSYFKNTCVTVTGISDLHKVTAVSLKSQILKEIQNINMYMYIMYINDIFLFPDNGCLSNYADDTTSLFKL